MDRRSARLREERLARKRNEEYRRELLWKDVTQYYNVWQVRASKLDAWSSPHFDQNRKLKAEKENHLQERKKKLMELISREEIELKKELELIKESMEKKEKKMEGDVARIAPNVDINYSHLDIPKVETVRNIQSSRASSQLLLNRNSSPNDAWKNQMREKELKEKLEKERTAALEKMMKEKIEMENEKEKQSLEMRKQEMRELKDYLKTQMEEIRLREAKTKELKEQEANELRLKMELERISKMQRENEQGRIKKEHFSVLKRQYESSLKSKAKQVEKEVQEDKELMEQLASFLDNEKKLNDRRREEARREIDNANKVLKEYAEIEKERQKQMDFLFNEEAKRVWEKQEARWKAEEAARNNLLKDVISTLKQQVNEKLRSNLTHQEKLFEDKESILNNVERTNEQLKRNEIEMEHCKRKILEIERELSGTLSQNVEYR